MRVADLGAGVLSEKNHHYWALGELPGEAKGWEFRLHCPARRPLAPFWTMMSFLAGTCFLMPCRFLGDESGVQTAGTVPLGHLSLLVREGKRNTLGLVIEALECPLEKRFSFLPSFAAAFLCHVSYFVQDESWKPCSLIEFSAISPWETGSSQRKLPLERHCRSGPSAGVSVAAKPLYTLRGIKQGWVGLRFAREQLGETHRPMRNIIDFIYI